MSDMDDDVLISKSDITKLYKLFLEGKSVRLAETVWWWNLSYGVKKR